MLLFRIISCIVCGDYASSEPCVSALTTLDVRTKGAQSVPRLSSIAEST